MASTSPLHVVIAGGGVAALEALMALHDLAEDHVRITLLAPNDEFELKPLRVAEPFAVDHVRRHPLRDLARRFGAEFHQGALASVDVDGHQLTLANGDTVGYDVLLLATGARSRPAYDRVTTFGMHSGERALNDILADMEGGYTRSITFVVPPGVTWSLPLYELALMTAAEVRGMGIDDAEITLVTPESTPLAIFGHAASEAVSDLLRDAGVTVRTDAYAEVEGGRVRLTPAHDELHPQRIVALPVLEGPAIEGVPADEHGFVPIDDHARVRGADDVYAAGDGANFPVKQGGLACQQADAAAEHIAARAGAAREPHPFHPVLRGKLLTGRGAQYLRNALAGGDGDSTASDFELWFPPTKVSGRYLSQWLAYLDSEGAGEPGATPPPSSEPQVDVEVPLPSPEQLAREAMALDPYSPVRP